MINNGKTEHQVQSGDKVAQLILENAQTPEVVNITHLLNTTQDDKGFGSTDMPPKLAEVFEITLGHAHSSKLQPKEERLADIQAKLDPVYHKYNYVFNSEKLMSEVPPTQPGYNFKLHLQDGAKLPPPS